MTLFQLILHSLKIGISSRKNFFPDIIIPVEARVVFQMLVKNCFIWKENVQWYLELAFCVRTKWQKCLSLHYKLLYMAWLCSTFCWTVSQFASFVHTKRSFWHKHIVYIILKKGSDYCFKISFLKSVKFKIILSW